MWMGDDAYCGRELGRGISNQGPAAAIRYDVKTSQRVTPNHVEFGDLRTVTDSKYALTEG